MKHSCGNGLEETVFRSATLQSEIGENEHFGNQSTSAKNYPFNLFAALHIENYVEYFLNGFPL
jgi:hypothetical protein